MATRTSTAYMNAATTTGIWPSLAHAAGPATRKALGDPHPSAVIDVGPQYSKAIHTGQLKELARQLLKQEPETAATTR
jgi:hypothetical protein